MPARCIAGACDNVRTSSVCLHEYPGEKTCGRDRIVSCVRLENVRILKIKVNDTHEQTSTARLKMNMASQVSSDEAMCA